MDPYVKLFRSILLSTIWQETAATRLVWVAMMALADRDGIVYASIPGLASTARVTVAECREAIKILLSPDPDSRSKAEEGRRLKEIDGGWILINYGEHRHRASMDEVREKAALRAKAYRERLAAKNKLAQQVVSKNKR